MNMNDFRILLIFLFLKISNIFKIYLNYGLIKLRLRTHYPKNQNNREKVVGMLKDCEFLNL